MICCPCGTGGTLAGIAAGLRPGQLAIGFPVLKGGDFLAAEVEQLQTAAAGPAAGFRAGSVAGGGTGNWRLECGFHFRGYARTPPELTRFTDSFEARHGLRLDRIYVAKMMFGIVELARRRAFEPGTRIVAVITGSPGPG